ncbi:MAG: hypothetical protein II262_05255 [Alistipes sp.]|nr:hypothetical protein [Alistipes sp.]
MSTILRQFFLAERWLAFGDPSPLRFGNISRSASTSKCEIEKSVNKFPFSIFAFCTFGVRLLLLSA